MIPSSTPLARLSRLLLVATLAAAGLVACGEEHDTHRRSFLAFGTVVQITIHGADEHTARAALDAVEEDFRYMHNTWHPWQPSALARVNALLETGAWFSVAPSVRPLIIRARELSRRSDGLFNPAIGRLVQLWGFHQDERPPGPPPASEAIERLVAAGPGMEDLELDGIRLRSTNPAVQLDFGAFAKGYGIDRAVELLRQRGIANALVNAGGDLRAIGRHGKRPWRIGIRDPRGSRVLASVEIDGDECVFTSGDYERFFEHRGERYHHILDPRTGRPARGARSVTVLHGEGAVADAAATALFVAEPQRRGTLARAMGVEAFMVMDAEGVVHMSQAMAERLHFERDPAPKTAIVGAP